MFSSCSSNWSILWIFQRGSLAPRQCHPWQIHPRSWIARWRSYLPLLVQLPSFVAIEDRCRSPKGQQCFTCNSATRKMPCFWRCKMVGDRVLGLFNTALRQGFTSVSYDIESALKFATQSNQGRQGNLKARFFFQWFMAQVFNFSTKRNMKIKIWCFRHDRSAKRSSLVIQEWQAV